MVQETGLLHKATNLVCHTAFREVQAGKVVKGIMAAGFNVADTLQGDGPKDVVTVVKAALHGASKAVGADVAAVEAAIHQLPGTGMVVAKSLVNTAISSIGMLGNFGPPCHATLCYRHAGTWQHAKVTFLPCSIPFASSWNR